MIQEHEIVGLRTAEFGIKCSSNRRSHQRGQLWHIYNQQIAEKITSTLVTFSGVDEASSMVYMECHNVRSQ